MGRTILLNADLQHRRLMHFPRCLQHPDSEEEKEKVEGREEETVGLQNSSSTEGPAIEPEPRADIPTPTTFKEEEDENKKESI